MKDDQTSRPLPVNLEAIAEAGGVAIPAELAAIASYPRNDTGHAQVFVDRNADRFRYAPGVGWLAWAGTRWDSPGDGPAIQSAKELSRVALEEANEIDDDDKRSATVRRALQMGNAGRIKAALHLAESDPSLHVRPSQLDSDPMLVGCLNGAVDLRSGQFHPPDPGDLITMALGSPWDEGATCPTWERFLDDVMQGDEALVAFIRRAVGYTLTGDLSEQLYFFLHGIGANGKSVFISILEALLGDYRHRASAELLERSYNRNKSPEIAEMRAKRLVVASETREGSSLDERLVKDLTGGETLRGERKYEAGFDFQPQAKLWISGNHRPRICGTDEGIWRRVRLLPFNARFEGDRCDPRMGEKLRAELPGILNWAVRGCLEWQREGLGLPEAVRQAVADYRDDEDILQGFVEERVQRAGIDDTVPKCDLYHAYQEWAKDEGLNLPLTRKRLTSRLKDRGFIADGKVWRGIRLVEHLAP